MKKLVLLAGAAATFLTAPAYAGADWTSRQHFSYSAYGQLQRHQLLAIWEMLYGHLGMGSFTGKSSGDTMMMNDVALWANVSNTHLDNDFNETRYNGDVRIFSIGAEKSVSDDLFAGLSLSYSDTDLTTDFNFGNHDGSAITIAPYVSYQIDDTFKADFLVGYAHGSMDMMLYDTVLTRNVTADQDYDRFFAGVNLTGTKTYDQWTLTGNTGFNWGHDRLDGYTNSESTTFSDGTNTLGEISVGARVDYEMETVKPYFSITYVNDVILDKTTVGATQPIPASDPTAVRLGTGVNFLETSNWSGGLNVSKEFGREDLNSHTLSMNLKYQF